MSTTPAHPRLRHLLFLPFTLLLLGLAPNLWAQVNFGNASISYNDTAQTVTLSAPRISIGTNVKNIWYALVDNSTCDSSVTFPDANKGTLFSNWSTTISGNEGKYICVRRHTRTRGQDYNRYDSFLINYAATVSSLAITSSGPYGIGETITVQATFSETVTIGTGSPARIPIRIGSNTRNAIAAPTSTTSTTHNFDYTVVSGDNDTDGIQVLTAARLANPARIIDAGNRGATVTALPDTLNSAQSSHKVDGIAPRVTLTSPEFIKSGSPAGSVSFSESVTGFDRNDIIATGGDPFSPTDQGNGRYAFLVARNADATSVTITIRQNAVRDAAGNGNAAVTRTTIFDATAPTITSLSLPSTGVYSNRDDILVEATFSEPVIIKSGTAPAIPITIGSNTRNATAAATNTASTKHTFSYTVVAADSDTDGIEIASSAVLANPGRIEDRATNAMTATALPDDLSGSWSGRSSHIVNGSQTRAITVTALAFTSSGPYKAGDVITLQATFNKIVRINSGAAPAIPITIGSNTRNATAATTSTSSIRHNFTYTVVSADSDTDGISVVNSATLANTAQLDGPGSNDIASTNLPDNLNSAQSSHKVDTTRPSVTGIALTSSGPYGVDSVIRLQATFSEAVTISTSGGTPYIPIRIGASFDGNATPAASATASTTHNFSYTVSASAPEDANGVQVKNNAFLRLDGGTISDAAGNNMSSISPLPDNLDSDQSGHVVDKTAPTVSSIALTSTGPYGVGDVITVAITFSEKVTVTVSGTTAPGITVEMGTSTGGNTRTASVAASATAKTTHDFNLTVTTADSNDSDGIRIGVASIASFRGIALYNGTINDEAGNAYVSAELPRTLATPQSAHKVDITAPTISSFRLTSSGTYRQGSVITLEVTFSENVIVGSGTAAAIPLTVGSNTRNATAAVNATAASTVNFTYTVASTDTDADGISVASSAVLTNPGRIMDAAGNAMTATTLPNTLNSNQSGHIVQPDSTPPTISSIAFSSTGPYKSGAVVMLGITFSEAVTIGSSNLPTVPLQIGSNSRTATAATAATAAATHNFSYTLVSADADTDGFQVLAASELTNPGTISDAAGNAMTATALPDNLNSAQSGHIIDNTRPTLTGIALTSDGPYKQGDIITIEATFSEAVTISISGLAPYIPLGISTNTFGHATAAANATASTTHNFSYTVDAVNTPEDANGVRVRSSSPLTLRGGTISDVAGNNLTNTNLPDTLNSDQSGHEIDKTAPTASSLAFASTGPYKADSVITVTVTFSEAVTITRGSAATNLPFINMIVSARIKALTSTATATANLTHNFSYTVVAADNDPNGVEVAAAAGTALNTQLQLNGGTISDVAGNAYVQAALPQNLATNQSGHKVDNTAPTISSFAFSSSGPYRQGGVITLQVTFDEAVTVGSGTAAAIPLTIGSNTRNATAAVTNTASTTVNFTYTIAGDSDADGISVASSAVLANPGRIMDAAGNALTGTALPDTLNSNQSGHIVSSDETPPTIASIAFASSGPYKTGAVVMLQITFSEPVVIGSSNLPTIPLQIGSNSRPATAAAAATAAATHNFNYTLVSADVDNDGFQVLAASELTNPGTISDAAGNAMTATALPDNLNSAQNGHIIDNTAPTITGIALTSDGPYKQGATITIRATFSEAVTISISGLAPYIPLGISTNTFGHATAAANATASTTHNFSYTVDANTPDDANGVRVRSSDRLQLRGGTISDVAGNNMSGSGTRLPGNLNSDQSGHEIDKTAPTVASLAFASTGPYKADSIITVTVTFNEAVTITRGTAATNLPSIVLTVGSLVKHLVATAAATASTTHNFSYTVVAADNDSNGVQVAEGDGTTTGKDLRLNGATINDAAGNAYVSAALPQTHNTDQSGHEVDNTAPTVSSFALTSSGIYRQGSVITLQVTFNEAVTVGSGTAAAIPLTIGSNTRNATAAVTNTASTTVNFTYTIAGDSDADGISVASSAVLANPGRIMDAAGNALTGTALPDTLNSNQSGHIVSSDETPPTIASIAFASSGPYKTGAVVMLQITFSEPVVIGSSNLPTIPLQIGSNSRPATAAAAATAAATHNFNYTLVSADVDNDGFQVLAASELTNPGTIADAAGNAMTATALPDTLNSAQSGHIIDNTAPTVTGLALTSSGPYKQGDTITIRATFSEAVTISFSGQRPYIPIGIGDAFRFAIPAASATAAPRITLTTRYQQLPPKMPTAYG